ncbi:two-component sensor histidine kinase [Sphaerisporangium rufum]|uniref:histidine kinase n=1 Tax=Sphaerisporangium rufum TaxID=1381558 RepID=A0A919QYT2_9ACTN|nr:histidine kinase [Sphaerisporangium rufum]GII76323.1 two-component sensor histidine kinase [Sphaerisporangium rufum]
MIDRARQVERRSWRTYLSPGWRVERSIGTIMMVAAPLTAPPGMLTALTWTLLGLSLAGWAAFVLLERRAPAGALVVLGASALAAAAAAGPTADGTAMIMSCVGLVAFSMHTRPSPLVIIAVTGAAVTVVVSSCVWSARPAGDAFGNAAVMLVVVVLGLSRRQYRVQAEHAHLLLEQTRRAQAEHARAAALDERARIAREIHDVLAQSLGALGVQLELADALLSEKHDLDGGLAQVRRARRLAAEGLSEARQAVTALREDTPPPAEALARLVEAHRADHSAVVDFEVRGTPRSPAPAVTVCLVRAAREALTNAARHAPNAAITVRLEYRAATVSLVIRNESVTRPAGDGAGKRPAGHGLTGMRERLALVGGVLTATEVQGGWQVVAEVPA